MVVVRLFRLPAALIVAAFIVFAACDGGGGSNGDTNGGKPIGPTVVRPPTAGEPRTVRLGLGSLPPERTSSAYIGAFATAAQYADTILIQRSPPWGEFMPGGSVSAETTELALLERALLRQYDGLDLFFAIDPTDGIVQRSRIVNLPPTVDPDVGFNDPKLREAFLAYTAYIAANYKPDYLALGVEINMLYQRSPRQFEAFVSLYREAYAQAKEASPRTKVFPTFQLEDLEGSFGDIHPPHWEVLEYFSGHMDALAISTYPFLAGIQSAGDLRPEYYSQLRARFDGEILIAETGYASAPVEGRVTVGTEEDQKVFLDRILHDAQENGFSTVVWLAALDPAFVERGATSVFKDIGLRGSDGGNKLAWSTWEEWVRRPFR